MQIKAKLLTVEQKKPYEKPTIEAIELKAEEVLAAGCKIIGGSSNVGNPSCGIYAGCVQPGS